MINLLPTERAIYIQDGEKNVQGFLSEAQSYYSATVTLKVGLDGSGDGSTKSD